MQHATLANDDTGEAAVVRRVDGKIELSISTLVHGMVRLDAATARQLAWVIIALTDPDMKR